MRIKRSVFSIILSFLHGFLLFFPIYFVVGEMAGLEHGDLIRFTGMGLWLLIPVVISYIMLRKLKRLFLYVLFSAIITVLAMIAGFNYGDFFNYGKIIMLVLNMMTGFIIFLVRGYSKVAHNELKQDFIANHDEDEKSLLQPWEIDTFLSSPSAIQWGWFVVLYIISLLVRNHYSLYVIFYVVVADMIVCFLYQYEDRFFDYLKLNTRVARMPLGAMKRVHMISMLAGVVMLILFMVPAIAYHKEPLENLSFSRSDHALIEVEPGEVNYEGVEIPENTELMELLNSQQQYEMPKWLVYMLDAIGLSAGVIALVLIGYGIIISILNMAKRFQLEDEDENIDLDEVEELRQGIRLSAVIKERLSERARIRKKYRQAIRKGTKGRPKSYATPQELEIDADFASKPEYDGLHELYEQARYGKND